MEARVNYEEIIREAEGLDWRTVNVMATDVAQTLMFAGPNDNAGARGTVGGYETDEAPEAMPQTQRSASCLCTQLDTARRNGDLGWPHNSGYVRVTTSRQTSVTRI